MPAVHAPAAELRRVLVVGGGVAGIACALQLRKQGLHVHLIDIDLNWRAYGAGLTITGPTLRALRTVGVLEEVVAQGYAYVGTVDTVIRAMEAQQKRQPVDWVFCYTYNSLVPHPVLMKSIETFWTKVMPSFR